MSLFSFAKRIFQSKLGDRGRVGANPLGDLIYVDSANGNDGNNGESKMHAVQTLTRALALAEAGDTIILNKGGSETVTASLAVSLARVKIICPVDNPEQGFTVQGAGTLNLMTVSAADVHIEGVKFVHTGTTSSAAGILTTAAADRLVVKGCLFDDSAIATTFTGLGLSIIDAVNAFVVEGCIFKDIKFGVKFTIATGISQVGSLIKGNTFFIGKAAAFGIATALTGTGAVKAARILENIFIEANGDGSAATTAWDGTDNTNATQGPIKLEAAADQYLIAGNIAYTALGTAFDVINAIAAGAVGGKAGNRTSAAVDVEGSLVVPSADATANSYERDVIGNKTDAAVNAVGTTKSIVAYLKGLLGYAVPAVATGTADIDDSVQDESAAYVPLLTITPAAGAPLRNVRVVLDLAKATTGFAAVESTATIQFRVARKVDGTNWRGGQAVLAAALSGTLAAGRSVEIDVGAVGVTQEARIELIMSADATADMEIPYTVSYEGMTAPTITPVAAG